MFDDLPRSSVRDDAPRRRLWPLILITAIAVIIQLAIGALLWRWIAGPGVNL